MIRAGFLILSLGLALGLFLSLFAFEPIVEAPEGMAEYNDLPRRMLRLSHVSAIMLPLLTIVFGVVTRTLGIRNRTASFLVIFGAALAPAALAAQALAPGLAVYHLPAAPILAFCIGVFLLTVDVWKEKRGTRRSRALHCGCCADASTRDVVSWW